MTPAAVVVSVGDELLAGRVLDTNAHWIASVLRARGVPLVRRVTVPDERGAIAEAVRDALRRAPIVVVGGGLGPTLDDLTRDGLADAFGVPIRRDAVLADALAARTRARGRPVTESTLRQADLPEGCVALDNPVGTAPAILREHDGTLVLAVAGVPLEFRTLIERHLLPRIDAWPGRARAPRTDSVTLCGIPEAEIGEALADLMVRDRDPSIGSYPRLGNVTLVVTSTASDDDEARMRVIDDIAEIRRRFPASSLPPGRAMAAEAVAEVAASVGATIAVAESLTAGLVASLLVDVPGASAYFRGGVVAYAEVAKERELDVPEAVLAAHGAVSEPVVRAMAEGVRRRFGTTHGVATTGVAGPGPDRGVPEGTVWVAVADASTTVAVAFRFGGGREQIRGLAAGRAVDLLRRQLCGLPPTAP